ncbi:MAG: response regulator transcription factor [Nitrosomonas sp.]|nr:MAG: response regulator transcription factor [Nitrosomonas sp.]
MPAEKVINIMLVEDHWLVRESIRNGLSKYGNIRFVAEAENGDQVFKHLKTKAVDLILMDYQLPDYSLWGIELSKKILKQFPQIKIILWSIHTREEDIISAMRVGCHGYLSKQKTNDEIKNAIDKVMHGEKIWPLDLVNQIEQKRLSPMKMKVTALLVQGKCYKQIAYDLLKEEYSKKISRLGAEHVLREFGSFEKYIMQPGNRTHSQHHHRENLKKSRWESRKRTVEGYATAIKKWFGAKSLCMLGWKIFEKGRLEYRRTKSVNPDV